MILEIFRIWESKIYPSTTLWAIALLPIVPSPVELTNMSFSLTIKSSDIELNQHTLKEGSRVRTDDPNRYWDDSESVNNPCPDCGCEMTFETEGGNGFCVNCAPNH